MRSRRMTLVAHTDGDPAVMAAPLREVVQSIDINVPVYRVETMEELYAQRTVAVANLLVGISTIVGLVGLCLALVGLYAIVSYQVSRRVREIGIRMALGAVRAQVLGMILRQAAVMGIDRRCRRNGDQLRRWTRPDGCAECTPIRSAALHRRPADSVRDDAACGFGPGAARIND